MIAPILPIAPAAEVDTVEGLLNRPSSGTSGAEFAQAIHSAIESVQQSQTAASNAVTSVLEGKSGELHSAILATQRSELQFQFFLQVRNKTISAYQEIMRVQI